VKIPQSDGQFWMVSRGKTQNPSPQTFGNTATGLTGYGGKGRGDGGPCGGAEAGGNGGADETGGNGGAVELPGGNGGSEEPGTNGAGTDEPGIGG